MRRRDLARIEVRRRISARRLIEGGPAIFAVVAINHHIHILGRRARSPLVKKRLRVEVVS